MFPSSARLLTFVAAVLCVSTLAVSQQADASNTNAQGISVEDFLQVQEFAQLLPITVSADGRWLGYTVQKRQEIISEGLASYARTGVPPWAAGTEIHVLNLVNGETKTISSRTASSWLPKWSPDGRFLAFLSDRDGQAGLWVWELAKGQARRVSDANVRGNQIEWTPDSKKLLITAVPKDISVREYAGRLSPGENVAAETHDQGELASTVAVYRAGSSESGKPGASEPWSLDVHWRDLIEVDLEKSQSKTIVHGGRISTYLLSPTGSEVAYTIPKRFEKPGSQQALFDVAIAGLASPQARVVASDVHLDLSGDSFSWSPEGTHISFCTGGAAESLSDCYVASLQEPEPRNLTAFSAPAAAHSKSGRPLWNPDGHIYFVRGGALWRVSLDGNERAREFRVPGRSIVSMIPRSENLLWMERGAATVVVVHDDQGKQDAFYRIDLNSGKADKILEQGQCYTCSGVVPPFVVMPNGRGLLYFSEDVQHDLDLWITDFDHAETRITHLNPRFDRQALGSGRLVHWLSDDGEPLQGAVLLPPEYSSNHRYPLIVWVYGGLALSNNFNRFGLAFNGPFNLQWLATHGYAVLLPDAPQHVGTPMLDLAKTVLPGVNKLIEMGIADPDRLGVIGHSYGGYSVLSLLVQTGRFKAAIMANGTGNLISAYGQMAKDGSTFGMSLAEEGQELMGATPWQARDRYIENSPIFYLNRIQTPLLIIHGDADISVFPFLSDEIFVDLRRLGKEVEYAKYAGEGHSPPFWRYENQLDLCRRIESWFDSHLKR